MFFEKFQSILKSKLTKVFKKMLKFEENGYSNFKELLQDVNELEGDYRN